MDLTLTATVSAIADPSAVQRERRMHPRLQCRGKAEMLLLPDGPKLEGSLINLSLGGCCIECVAKILLEPPVSVEVQLKVDDSRLRLAGVLRYVEDLCKAGIQFDQVSPRKEEQIRELIAELYESEKHRLSMAMQIRAQEEAEDI